MAQVNFNSIQLTESSPINNNSVGFFSLKNDGDTAVVRFMHDNVSSFELYTVHNILVADNRYRKINCLREPEEPFDKCPLCAAGEKVQQRFFIHLIQYVQDENGRIIGLPKVWERSATYAHKLKNLIDEYGPLSDCVFKIRRNGVARSMDTSYDIMFCNPNMYNLEQYPKNFEAFSNYRALGGIVMNKTFDEIVTYLNTGEFPAVERNSVPSNRVETPHASQSTQDFSQFTSSSTPVSISGNYSTPPQFTPIRDRMVNGNTIAQGSNQQVVQRPVRSYN